MLTQYDTSQFPLPPPRSTLTSTPFRREQATKCFQRLRIMPCRARVLPWTEQELTLVYWVSVEVQLCQLCFSISFSCFRLIYSLLYVHVNRKGMSPSRTSLQQHLHGRLHLFLLSCPGTHIYRPVKLQWQLTPHCTSDNGSDCILILCIVQKIKRDNAFESQLESVRHN